jgi:hypothetical protein
MAVILVGILITKHLLFINGQTRAKVYPKIIRGESRGKVVKAEDSQLSGCGFKPPRRILDGVSEASYYKLQLKKKKRNKGSQMGHTKKNI